MPRLPTPCGPEQRSQGVPPNWMLYISVASADDAAKHAKAAGGTVLKDAFDVGESGRMAVLQDPTGAVFAVWQANKNQGIGIAHVDGTLCWADLSTPDPQRAGKFYSDLFGWQMMQEDEDPEHDYLHIKNGEHFIGGIPPAKYHNSNAPAHWLAYILTSNCDATADKAKQLGARFICRRRPWRTLAGWPSSPIRKEQCSRSSSTRRGTSG